MSFNLNSLKKNSSIDKLTQQMEKLGATKKSYKDDRFYQPEIDKAGNGYAVIRFLSAPFVDGEEGVPFVMLWTHGFKGPGGWYIDNCLTTINQDCPACKHNTTLWNSGVESDKKLASSQKRKLNYISNILVVSDPKNPENEGKVFLYKYGKKIYDKINLQAKPQFPDDPKVDVFNFWEGANFRLKIRNFEGQRNYDLSTFDSPTSLFDGDDSRIEKVWKESHSLRGLLDHQHFKTFDELKGRLDKVLGAGGAAAAVAKRLNEAEEQWEDTQTLKQEPPAKPRVTAETLPWGDAEEDDMSFFEKLAGD